MRKKAIFIGLGVLLIAALTLTAMPGAAGAKDAKPGGTLTYIVGAVEPDRWDPIEYSSAQESAFIGFYLENLLGGDLSKGARGTKGYWFNDMYWVPDKDITGRLAESWSFSDPLTVTFRLRHGVMWPDKPGVMKAREMTSADVVYSLKRLIDYKKKLGTRYIWMESVSAPDAYTVVLKLSEFSADWLWRMTARGTKIIPTEMAQVDITDWKNAVGTGPFRLVDYTKGSALTYEKNPKYWDQTSIGGKKYKLPFVDKVVLPFISDESTALAALQSGKADILPTVSWEFRDSLKKSNPNLKEFKMLGGVAVVIGMKEDTAPFSDLRVRQAMSMAVDRKAYVDSQAGGEAVPLSWPFSAAWGDKLFTPLNKYPQAVQEAFRYNPEKAKKLLAEAGYPNGFKTGMIFSSAGARLADVASLLASHWKKVGVEVELKPMEQSAFVGLVYQKQFTDMVMLGHSNSSPISIMRNVGEPKDFYNMTAFNHPDWYKKFLDAKDERDYAKQEAMLKDLNRFVVSTGDYIILPTGYVYRYAQPWVNNYFGETNTGSLDAGGQIIATIWIDPDAKKK